MTDESGTEERPGLVPFGTDLHAEQEKIAVEGVLSLFEATFHSLGMDDTEAANTMWFALREYLDKLLNDLHTGFNGDEKFGFEDQVFLGDQIAKIANMLFRLQQAGFVEKYLLH